MPPPVRAPRLSGSIRAQRLLSHAAALGAEFVDVRSETVLDQSAERVDGDTRALRTQESGVGVRVLAGGAWGFASTTGAPDATLARDAVRSARAAARFSRVSRTVSPLRPGTLRGASRLRIDPSCQPFAEWFASLSRLERETRGIPEIRSTTLAIRSSSSRTEIETSEGRRARIFAGRVLLQADIVARRGPRTSSYRMRLGATGGMEHLSERRCLEAVRDACRRAVRQLDAKRPPAGRMPVITDPDLTGVFCHEAIGHACEADLVIAGESQLGGRLGEAIAPPHVSVVDDPTVPHAYGSFAVDDEGVRAKRKHLLRSGVLSEFIHSRETAAKLSGTANGGARAESFACEPLVRMSNTFLMPQDWTLEEMLEEAQSGVFALGSRGGQVDTAKGPFQFTAQEAFRIENGEVAGPLRDVALSGTMLGTLRSIEAVGKELRLGSPGMCGKGQWVPVCDGGPYMLLSGATVGGG